MKIMTDEWFPFVTKKIKAKHGWDTFYYGNASTPGRGGGGGGRGRGGREGRLPRCWCGDASGGCARTSGGAPAGAGRSPAPPGGSDAAVQRARTSRRRKA